MNLSYLFFNILVLFSIFTNSYSLLSDSLPKTLNDLLNSRVRISTTNEPEYVDDPEEDESKQTLLTTVLPIKSYSTMLNMLSPRNSILTRNLQKIINLEYQLDNMIFKMSMDFRYKNNLEFNENDLKNAECLTNRNSLLIKLKKDWTLEFNITMINGQGNNLTSKKMFKLNQLQFDIDKGTKEYETNVEDHRLDDQNYQRCFFN